MNEIQLYDKFCLLYWEQDDGISKQDTIKEFLQTRILEYINTTNYSDKFILVWWSAIRLFYNGRRISNDLDFNTTWMSESEFEFCCNDIKDYLISLWHTVSIKIQNKKYFHCKFRIISRQLINSVHIVEKSDVDIKIKFDAADDNWNYPIGYLLPNKTINNIPILTTYWDVLLSKKIVAFLSRSHYESIAKDLYDILYLFEMYAPNFQILEEYEYISSFSQLFDRLYKKISERSDEIILNIDVLQDHLLKPGEVADIYYFINKLKK